MYPTDKSTPPVILGKVVRSLFSKKKKENRTEEEKQIPTFNQCSVRNLSASEKVELMKAVEMGDTTTLNNLLEKKVNICNPFYHLDTGTDFSPIFETVTNNDLRTFTFMLESLKEPLAYMQKHSYELIHLIISKDRPQFLEQLHERHLLPPEFFIVDDLMINLAIKFNADNVFQWLLDNEDTCTKSDKLFPRRPEDTFFLALGAEKYEDLIKLMIKRETSGNEIFRTGYWLKLLTDKTIIDIAAKAKSEKIAGLSSVLKIMMNHATASKNEKLINELLEIGGDLFEPESDIDEIRKCPRNSKKLMETLKDIASNSEKKKTLFSTLQSLVNDKSLDIDDINWILKKATEGYSDQLEFLVDTAENGLPLLIKTCIELRGRTEPVYRLALAIGSRDMENFSKFLKEFVKQDYAGNKEVALTSLCKRLVRDFSSDQPFAMLKTLIEEGANPDQILHNCFHMRRPGTAAPLNERELSVIEFLLVNKRELPNHTVSDNFGKPTLLEYALRLGYFDAAKLLIKFGADVDRIMARNGLDQETPSVTIREYISDAASSRMKAGLQSAEQYSSLMELINQREAVNNNTSARH